MTLAERNIATWALCTSSYRDWARYKPTGARIVAEALLERHFTYCDKLINKELMG